MLDKQKSELKKSLRRDEDGAVYVLAIFLVIILLAMAGLAVDAGNIYHARIQLQKATDTGALAGMGSLFINDNVPTDPTAIPSYVEARALELTTENLRAQGFDISTVNIEPSYDLDTRTLTVNADAVQEFLVMDAVPFQLLGLEQAASTRPISATAEVRREPANIALVLDMSTSMECPSIGTCDCKTPARDPAVDCAAEADSQGTTQKFEELETAVATFLDYFDPTFDRVSLTLF
jgi:Flp pilus assembly protein TadG